MLYGLDLFSGIGGLTIALQEWVKPIAYCENDRYAQGVLLSRMSEGELPIAPIWDDAKTLKGKHLPVKPDIIIAGFPCQDISVAGVGRGLAGKRSGLFFEIIRLANEIRPQFIFLENVSGITTQGGWEASTALSEIRYDCRWGMLSAYDMGAPHIRERWFCLAYNNENGGGLRQESRGECENKAKIINDGKEESMANANKIRSGTRNERIRWEERTNINRSREGTDMAFSSKPGLQNRPSEKDRQDWLSEQFERCSYDITNPDSKRSLEQGVNGSLLEESKLGSCCGEWDWWQVEPDVGRVVDGLPHRVDRIKCLGNAVVPCQAREAFMRLIGLK